MAVIENEPLCGKPVSDGLQYIIMVIELVTKPTHVCVQLDLKATIQLEKRLGLEEGSSQTRVGSDCI